MIRNRRQFGNVRRLPSGRFQASYWHNGRRHVAPITFAFKADASAYLSTVETEILRNLWIDPAGAQVLFSDWAEQWSSTVVDLRPSTRARDLGYLERYVLPHFGSVPSATSPTSWCGPGWQSSTTPICRHPP